jgi:hypothetical protein
MVFGMLLALATVPFLAGNAVAQRQTAVISPAAEEVASILDSMDVEHGWLPKTEIHWQSGKTIRVLHTPGAHTHCSAFVAVACEKLGVPILAPPPQNGLANLQQDWLLSEGVEQGWKEIPPAEAQALANRGLVVVASFKNENRRYHAGHGHIAVVRPCEKTLAELDREGPQIAQAGGHNYSSTTLYTGFRTKTREVRFFAHARPSS